MSMTNMDEAGATVNILRSLRSQLEPSLTESLGESQLFVDLADMYEICRAYIASIDIINSSEADDDKLKDVFYEIDCQFSEHLPYHLNSLMKL